MIWNNILKLMKFFSIVPYKIDMLGEIECEFYRNGEIIQRRRVRYEK